ncbi:hypothetical protein X975_26686, partial [Stegodyphus mimosarum]
MIIPKTSNSNFGENIFHTIKWRRKMIEAITVPISFTAQQHKYFI